MHTLSIKVQQTNTLLHWVHSGIGKIRALFRTYAGKAPSGPTLTSTNKPTAMQN